MNVEYEINRHLRIGFKGAVDHEKMNTNSIPTKEAICICFASRIYTLLTSILLSFYSYKQIILSFFPFSL